MDTSEKNIKEVFSTYITKVDIDLEKTVLDEINLEKDYKVELSRSRKRIKIGLILSAILLVVYVAFTYSETLLEINSRMEIIGVYSPAMFTAILVFIMYLLSISFISSKNKIDDMVYPE